MIRIAPKMLEQIKADLEKVSNPTKAIFISGYLKSGKPGYPEKDLFLGVTVPLQRSIARKNVGATLSELSLLLNSKIHEHRLTALLILAQKYKKSNERERKELVTFYLSKTEFINNWDLVDASAAYILGDYLLNKDKAILYYLAKSDLIWERRISIVSTHAFIKKNQLEETLKVAEILLEDDHDLIHKAVGWMLREVGKKDQKIEEEFLMKFYHKMPRTMLRYAIEKFDAQKRAFYMKR